jgi:APA family basic amino acid/polyamine antiporter
MNNSIPEKNSLKRALGLFSCIMLVVGNMIGVGIFTTPGSVAARLPSSGLILLAWILGAFLSIAGALSYAELGAAYPFAGGNYVFLREAYGKLWAFLYGWTAAFITQTGTLAVLAIGFCSYAGISGPAGRVCAIALIIFFGLLNYLGVEIGAGSMDVITALKILSIAALALIGMSSGDGAWHNFSPAWAPSGGMWMAALATSLIPVMYTYSGWNATVYVGSEVKNPSRIIPLSLLFGVLITAVLYVSLNVFYIYAVPVDRMRGVIAVAQLASITLFGTTAAKILSAMIAVSILGCINATLLTAPRIPFAMAQDGLLFKRIAAVHPRFRTPGAAIVMTTLWACLLVLWGNFDQLLVYVTFPSLLMNLLTVIALFVLRRTKPELERPYRAWGYPLVPASFVLMTGWILVNVIWKEPAEAAFGIAITCLGIPFFYFFQQRREREPLR